MRKQKKKLSEQEKTERKAVLDAETKEEKFVRLANQRVKKALKALTVIINLSNPAYSSTPEQREKIINALRLKVLDIEKVFKAQTEEKEKEPEFTV